MVHVTIYVIHTDPSWEMIWEWYAGFHGISLKTHVGFHIGTTWRQFQPYIFGGELLSISSELWNLSDLSNSKSGYITIVIVVSKQNDCGNVYEWLVILKHVKHMKRMKPRSQSASQDWQSKHGCFLSHRGNTPKGHHPFPFDGIFPFTKTHPASLGYP